MRTKISAFNFLIFHGTEVIDDAFFSTCKKNTYSINITKRQSCDWHMKWESEEMCTDVI